MITFFVGVLVGILICSVHKLIRINSRKTAEQVVKQEKRARGEKMLEVAERVGAVLYYNKKGNTTAFCRVQDFQKEVLSAGWKGIGSVEVYPTFIFYQYDIETTVHVFCTEMQREEMLTALVEKTTGYTKGEVDWNYFDCSRRLLIVENKHLFVPFTKSVPVEEEERLLNFYGKVPRSLSQVREYIMGSVN